MNRIEWEDVTPGNGAVGFVQIAKARVKIASVSWSFNRADEKPWVLRTEIPGWTNARHHASREDAQASAERILYQFGRAVMGDQPVTIVVDDPSTIRETRNAPNGVLVMPTEAKTDA